MWMAEAADRAAWNRTFAVVAQLYNAFRGPKRHEAIDPMQFFPWQRAENRPAPPPTPEERAMLRQAFSGKRKHP